MADGASGGTTASGDEPLGDEENQAGSGCHDQDSGSAGLSGMRPHQGSSRSICLATVEIYLLGHEGGNSHGEFCFTLTMVDITTGWTVNRNLLNKSPAGVVEAIKHATQRFPFPILGIDFDDDSEFINAHLLNSFETNEITFTRARPRNRNDGCHVEQENRTHVHTLVGYMRYDTPQALQC